MSNNQAKFDCTKCGKVYSMLKNLRSHVRETHPEDLKTIAPLPERKCSVSEKQINTKPYLSSHERNQHNIVYDKKTIYKCPLCAFQHARKSVLCEHFSNHDIKIETEEMNFENFQKFKVWKENIEQKTGSKFVTTSSGHQSRKTKFLYYECYRSGYFVSKSKGIRQLKSVGSSKINGFCPAAMTVRIDESVRVEFTKTHVGHVSLTPTVTLESESKSNVLNMPFDLALDKVRESVSGNGDLERLHHLTKVDILDIEKSLNLNINTKQEKGDVDQWIKDVRDNESGVLFYKPQQCIDEQFPELEEDDFVLVLMNEAQGDMLRKYGHDVLCVDRTRSLNQYNFELVMLLTLDDLRQGFPCAFLVSNRIDEDVLSIFFKSITDELRVFATNIFMSDVGEAFYDAFEEEMPKPKKRLFCSWLVDQDWRANLIKIEDKDKQIEVYKILRTLLEETYPMVFKKTLNDAITKFENDPALKEFAVYFESKYLQSVESWANCFRGDCGLQSSMPLERLHMTIKHIYLQGKRFDEMLIILMNFLRERFYDRAITLPDDEITKDFFYFEEDHDLGLNLEADVVKDGDVWMVLCLDNYKYCIRQNKIHCECNLRCLVCKTCIHMFSCTCMDYCIKWILCQHIHFFCTNEGSANSITDNQSFSTQVESEVEVPPVEHQCIFKEINILKTEYGAVLDKIKTNEDLEIARSYLKLMETRLQTGPSHQAPFQPPDKNTEVISVASSPLNVSPQQPCSSNM